MRFWISLFLFLFVFVEALPCFAEVLLCAEGKRMEVRGASMEPLLREGATVSVLPLACGPGLKYGDVVVFLTGAHKEAPVIKRVVGLEGDRLRVADDGAVFVNDRPVFAVDGMPYVVAGRRLRMLRFYQGVLPEKTVFVLGRSGSLDSSRIGLVHFNDILGRVLN